MHRKSASIALYTFKTQTARLEYAGRSLLWKGPRNPQLISSIIVDHGLWWTLIIEAETSFPNMHAKLTLVARYKDVEGLCSWTSPRPLHTNCCLHHILFRISYHAKDITYNNLASAAMRLINVLDGHLEEYFGDDIPPYAIVSHTWEKDEVLFKHMPINDSPASTDTTYSNASAASRVAEDVSSEDTASWFQKFSAFHTPQLRARYGYFKIHKSCEQAFKESIGYVWVDTCSIDKSSSSELSEAINSTSRRVFV